MSKPLCRIVGIDGFDPDVLANLVVFYQACGYDVRIARAPEPCDLLVIQRGRYSGELFETRASACHVYDYGAHGTSDFHRAFPNISDCTVVALGDRVSGQYLPPRRVQGFHPVIPALWQTREGERAAVSYDLVHIGHRKPNPDKDIALSQIDAVAKSGLCHFWGSGWQALAPSAASVHGPASLHESQQIYRRAGAALGVMYPFQRGRTMSGRMWQAPLNGCVLYSEAIPPDLSLPGVVRCMDFRDVVDDLSGLAVSGLSVSSRLPAEAVDFWADATRRLAASLGLSYAEPSTLTTRRTYLKWIYARHIADRLVPRGSKRASLRSALSRAL